MFYKHNRGRLHLVFDFSHIGEFGAEVRRYGDKLSQAIDDQRIDLLAAYLRRLAPFNEVHGTAKKLLNQGAKYLLKKEARRRTLQTV